MILDDVAKEVSSIIGFEKGNRLMAFSLAICSMFRNEARYLNEWITFHLERGVDRFYLFDDDSTDTWSDTLESFIKAGVVLVEPAAGRSHMDCLQAGLELASRHDFVAFIDIDEFLFSPTGNLVDQLTRDTSVAGVFVYWTLFGSSGRPNPPEGTVVGSFGRCLPLPRLRDDITRRVREFREIKRGAVMTGFPLQGKTIVRPMSVKLVGNHFPKAYRGVIVNERGDHLSATPGRLLRTDSWLPSPSDDAIALNHYWSKSLPELLSRQFRRAASQRGRTSRLPKPSAEQLLAWDSILNSADCVGRTR